MRPVGEALDLAINVGLGDRLAQEDVPRVEDDTDAPSSENPSRLEVALSTDRPNSHQAQVDDNESNDVACEIVSLTDPFHGHLAQLVGCQTHQSPSMPSRQHLKREPHPAVGPEP
jgi:hypothetical protein